jgi:hypothetical protein
MGNTEELKHDAMWTVLYYELLWLKSQCLSIMKVTHVRFLGNLSNFLDPDTTPQRKKYCFHIRALFFHIVERLIRNLSLR